MTDVEIERLLAIGLILVYWIDATWLLKQDEALVEHRGGTRWRVLFGWVGFELGGRRVCWPNLARPDRVSGRVRWHLAREPKDDIEAMDASAIPQLALPSAQERTLGRLCLASLMLVVFAGPCLLWLGRSQAFAAVILVAWLLSVTAGAFLLRHAGVFGIGTGTAVGAAVIAVVCLPCAPNLLRAAVSRRCAATAISLPRLARLGSTGETDWADFSNRFIRVLAWQEATLVPGSPEHLETRAVLSDLRGLSS